MKVRLRHGDDARILWIVALFTFGAGYHMIDAHYETAAAASHARSDDLYRRITANDLTIAQTAALQRVEQQIRRDLSRVSTESRSAISAASFLDGLQALARTFRVAVISVDAPRSQPKIPSLEDMAIAATPLTITLQGRFGEILGFLQQLPHQPALLEIGDTQLAVVTQGPRLQATIHATLYRVLLQNIDATHD